MDEPQADLAGWPAGTVQVDTSPARKSARASAFARTFVVEFVPSNAVHAALGDAAPHPVAPLQGP